MTINPWDEYAKELKQWEIDAGREWPLVVSTEIAGWTENFNGKRYIDWINYRDQRR